MGNAQIGRRVVLESLAIMLVLSAGTAVAQERTKVSSQQQRQSWWEKKPVQSELGLSAHQVSAIAEIEEANREVARRSRKAQQMAYRNMVKTLTVGTPSDEEIAERRRALEEAWAGSVRQSVEHWIKLREELSSAQWEKLPRVAPRALQLGGFRTHAMGTITVGAQSD